MSEIPSWEDTVNSTRKGAQNIFLWYSSIKVNFKSIPFKISIASTLQDFEPSKKLKKLCLNAKLNSARILIFLNCLNNFHSMSTCLGLFYAKRRTNCVHCTLTFTFNVVFFAHSYQVFLYNTKNLQQLYSFKYSDRILIVIWFQVIISI